MNSEEGKSGKMASRPARQIAGEITIKPELPRANSLCLDAWPVRGITAMQPMSAMRLELAQAAQALRVLTLD